MDRRSQPAVRRLLAGFTLVELLVVIGIIAVLIGIMMPTLGRAREKSRKVQCLANLRQVHAYFIAYAMAYDGVVPIGYKDVKASNYNLVDTASPVRHHHTFGTLFAHDRSTDPKAFYCPAESYGGFLIDDPVNRSTATAPNGGVSPLPFGLIRSGYGCRPVVPWSNTTSAVQGKLPRLSMMKNLAMFGDSPTTPASLVGRHPDGVNVLYTGGDAHWIDKSAFIENVKRAEAAGAFTTGANNYYLSGGPDATATGMWADFDRN